jgi:hypothetical protein
VEKLTENPDARVSGETSRVREFPYSARRPFPAALLDLLTTELAAATRIHLGCVVGLDDQHAREDE